MKTSVFITLLAINLFVSWLFDTPLDEALKVSYFQGLALSLLHIVDK